MPPWPVAGDASIELASLPDAALAANSQVGRAGSEPLVACLRHVTQSPFKAPQGLAAMPTRAAPSVSAACLRCGHAG